MDERNAGSENKWEEWQHEWDLERGDDVWDEVVTAAAVEAKAVVVCGR